MTVILTPMTQENQVVNPLTCEKIPFNINTKVSEGQSITINKSKEIYGVLKVLPNTFRYYNKATGELTNHYSNTNLIDIETV